ncbi:MAG: GSCFA domain-containing protein [Bacteroidales bacterium]|nr:GSCFA domain-containing protein [Bacteroidales bacterium]
MVKLTTPVPSPRLPFGISLKDKVVVLGSCLSDDLGQKFADAGFATMVNPFGTLYNPLSIENAIGRLDSAEPFTDADCVRMGAGSELVCSFEHYTKFARPTADEFLAGANAKLAEAAKFWREANVVVVILYSAWVWERGGRVVANCLKRPAAEFTRRLIGVDEVHGAVERITHAHPDKRFLWMVCPIRQGGEPRENTLGKATLQLGLQGATCFPAFEIVHDELRDYRFYADDLVHPSPAAVQILWERLLDSAALPEERETIAENERMAKTLKHRPLR